MTKCIVLGQEAREDKPIEFSGIVGDGMVIGRAASMPKDWANIELIAREYTMFRGEQVDLIFAYNDDRHYECALYLGHWNDGVV